MLLIKSIRDALPACQALGSEVRVEIMELVLKGEAHNLGALAKKLHLSNGALTAHIKKLEEARLVRVETVQGARGVQKLLHPAQDGLIVDFFGEQAVTSLKADVGHFMDYSINPPCGIDNAPPNNPTQFHYSERFRAKKLWFSGGFLEYRFAEKRGDVLLLTFEIGVRGSAIFELNSTRLGSISPQTDEPMLCRLRLDEQGATLNSQIISSLPHGGIERQPTLNFRIICPQGSTVWLYTNKAFGTGITLSIA